MYKKMRLFLLVPALISVLLLSACTNSVEFTINFDSNGGSEVSSIKTDGTSSITLPNDPIKDGYSFAGWYWDNSTFRDLFTVNSLLERGISGNLTVYAKWNKEDTPIGAIKVTFNSMGGSEVNPQYVQKDNTIAIPNTSKVGYTLDGWYTSLNNGQTFDEKWSFTNNKVTTDITLYAKWIINQYTITFNTNGGSSVSSISQDYDTLVTAPNNPTKLGYTFSGWSQPVPIKMPAEDVTLIAEWSINQYTIAFDSNGGSPVTAITQDYATTVSKPTDPTKVGYTFAGWYINSSLTTPYTFTTMPAQNITLYAKWVPLAYNINYELADGLNHLSNPSSYTIETNTIILSAPTKEGYTFEGWYSDSNFTNYVSEITIGSIGNLTLYAKWQNTITFNTNGGSLVESITQDYGTTVIQPNDPTREGYTFGGWFSDSGLAAAYTFSSMPSQNITLYAKWQNTITFNTNGGSLVEPITQDTLTTVVKPTDPSKEGYTFGGWYSDSSLTNAYTFTTMPSQNITLYAKWQLITHSITYVMNENTTNDASNPATYNVTSNISLIAPSVIEGTFIGWFTDEDYTNEIENISNMMGNITLYAKVEMNQYTMTFVTNGGTEISPITQDYDTAIHVSTTKEGYMFEAWCSDEGLTTSIDISKMPNANLTVYAKWAQMYEYFTIDNMTYVYYGTYPQTVVDDSSLISSLNSLTSTNANGYYEFEGEEYAKVVAHPCGNDYEFKNGYKFKNGSTIQSGQTYYFKVEPIKWRVLEEADGTYTLLSEYIIDKQVFYTSRDNRTIGDQTIYANNYEHSTIREWLNNAFYNKAFSTPEKGSILTTLVDNSASTTASSTNPYFSNNTMDKVYLLSYQEAISSTYGFSTDAFNSSTRTAVTTDYARAVGAYMDTSTSYYGNGGWQLRSPNIMYNISHFAHIVQRGGYINNSNVYDSFIGARPAIKIG